MNTQTTAMKTKLSELIRLDRRRTVFGVLGSYGYGHEYKSYPVSLLKLNEFESKLGVSLPGGFRDFMLQSGSGAGPGYGIFTVEKMFEELEEWRERLGNGTPSGMFDLTDQDADEMIFQKMQDPNKYDYKRLVSTNGILPLNTKGCTYADYIVLTGEQRGKVWSVEIDEFQCCPAGICAGKHFGFNEWYEKWLDISIHKLMENVENNKSPVAGRNIRKTWLHRLLGN